MINFYKINNYFSKKISSQNSIYQLEEYTVQKEILESVYQRNFEETYFSRSYCQYLCQKKLYKQKHFLLNIFSFLFVPLLLVLGVLRKVKRTGDFEVVYFGNSKKIPKFFFDFSIREIENKIKFREKDIHYFLKNIFLKCNGQYYFALKILLKIAFYRYNIEKYSAKILLVSSEYSYTSSILTEFCEINGVQHVNYMHGEKLYEIRDSFFRFHKCYVWDKHYINLFKSLKAYNNQFEELGYKSFLDFPKGKKVERKNNTYYLQLNETKDDIKEIVKRLKELQARTSYLGKIRCHPIYTVEEIRKEIPLEMLDEEPNLFISLFQSHYIISKYSTILYEAFILKAGILVVDDVTDEKIFQKLKSLDYIILQKSHRLLSDITKEVNHD